MHAALITGKEIVELREFAAPTPTTDGVVVDVQLCGICGTDIHAYQSGHEYNPAICGHEWTGVVSAIGGGVNGHSEGDRVVIAVPPSCGRCDACRRGQQKWCSTAFMVGIGRDKLAPAHGGFAPQIGVGANRVVKVNPGLTVEQAAQVEPAAVAFHAVRNTPPTLGDVTVVQGAGPIGLTTMQWVRAAGAGEIVVIEPNETRRDLAAELGATRTVTPGEAGDVIRDLTNGLGADVVYECVGRPETIQGAVDHTRRGGSMCLIGLAEGQATIDPAAWLVKEIGVRSALMCNHDDLDRTMGMIADGRVKLDPMHSSTVGLDGLGAALADLGSGSSAETKVLVDPRL